MCYVTFKDCSPEYESMSFIECTGSGGQFYSFEHQVLIERLTIHGNVKGLDVANAPLLKYISSIDATITCENVVGNMKEVIISNPQQEETTCLVSKIPILYL